MFDPEPATPDRQPWRTNQLGWPTDNIATTGELFDRLIGDRSARAVVGGVEAFVGFCTILVVIVGGGGVLGGSVLFNAWAYHYPRIGRPELIALSAAWAVAIALAARSLAFFLQALGDAGPPVPLSIARRWLDVPRPWVAGWWLLLSAVVLATSHYAASHLWLYGPTWYEWALARTASLLFLYGSAFAVNVNLLIAVAALTASEAAVRMAWRLRLGVDLLLVAAFVLFSRPSI